MPHQTKPGDLADGRHRAVITQLTSVANERTDRRTDGQNDNIIRHACLHLASKENVEA